MITKDFFNISWREKLLKSLLIIHGFENIRNSNIIHKDYHSGNIFIQNVKAVIGDLGLSKSLDNGDN